MSDDPGVEVGLESAVTDDTPSQRQSGRRRTLRVTLLTGLPAAVLLALFFIGWGVYVEVADVRDIILPSPLTVTESLFTEWGTYQPQLEVTMRNAITGFGLAVGTGVLLAVLVTSSPILRLALYPLLVASQAMPVIALAPLMVVWFGYGPTSKVLVAALISFFPVVVNSAAGLASLEPSAVTLMRSFPATKLQIFLRARLPNALPQMFSGIKIAAPLAVVGAVVGEWVSADAGLGFLIIRANNVLATEIVFGSIFLLSLAGIILFLAVALIERFTLPWHRSRA